MLTVNFEFYDTVVLSTRSCSNLENIVQFEQAVLEVWDLRSCQIQEEIPLASEVTQIVTAVSSKCWR